MVSQTKFNLTMDLIEAGVPLRTAWEEISKIDTTEIKLLSYSFNAWKKQMLFLELLK
jgi:hypothetical protein